VREGIVAITILVEVKKSSFGNAKFAVDLLAGPAIIRHEPGRAEGNDTRFRGDGARRRLLESFSQLIWRDQIGREATDRVEAAEDTNITAKTGRANAAHRKKHHCAGMVEDFERSIEMP